jgi:hypothetical protein
MVVMGPWEYRIAIGDTDSKDETIAQLMLDPQQAIFDNQDESKHPHLKVLYVNGKAMSKILVDGSATINIMSMTTFRRFTKEL